MFVSACRNAEAGGLNYFCRFLPNIIPDSVDIKTAFIELLLIPLLNFQI